MHSAKPTKERKRKPTESIMRPLSIELCSSSLGITIHLTATYTQAFFQIGTEELNKEHSEHPEDGKKAL